MVAFATKPQIACDLIAAVLGSPPLRRRRRIVDRLLDVRKARLIVRQQHHARALDRHDRGVALHIGDDAAPHADVIAHLGIGHAFQLGRDRRHETVAHQDAQERADQIGRAHV